MESIQIPFQLPCTFASCYPRSNDCQATWDYDGDDDDDDEEEEEEEEEDDGGNDDDDDDDVAKNDDWLFTLWRTSLRVLSSLRFPDRSHLAGKSAPEDWWK